jgi:hypothetical protein
MMNTEQSLGKIACGMAEMATTYPNDIIANNLARVSMKVESQGHPFAPKLDALDMKIVQFYLNKSK